MIREKCGLSGFLYIDRCCEGVDWSRPQEDEEYIGIPHGYYDHGAPGCIEVYKSGKLKYAVNLTEITVVEFLHKDSNV